MGTQNRPEILTGGMLKSLQLNTYKSLNHRKGPVITKFRMQRMSYQKVGGYILKSKYGIRRRSGHLKL